MPAHRYLSSPPPAPRARPHSLAAEERRLVHREAKIRLEGRRPAGPPELMGKYVWVRRLGQKIAIEHAGRIVATYTRREGVHF